MLHLLLDKRPWFETRNRCWYPRVVRREGHLLGIVFGLLLIGIDVLLYRGTVSLVGAIAAIGAATIWFMLLVRHKSARPDKR